MRLPNIVQNLFLIFISSLIIFPHTLQAEDAFNPNYIISDYELQAKNSMNREDIDAFLKKKGGAIALMKLPDKDGTVREASDIIYRAAQEHSINPKYLLVKLQKEQSLVEEKTPTQKQLDWATGYGICDSCSMSDPTLQKHRGFGIQVDSAAAIMRWYYDNLLLQPWIKRANASYNIDSTAVTPLNHATAFLYTYTPHIQGNKNFWTLWQKWFEQVYPDGTLIKGTNSAVVYLLKDSKKHPFKNMSALTSRFNPKLIVEVPQIELTNYPEGLEISLPNYAILQQGSKYYLLDDDILRPFNSHDTVRALGYNPDEIIQITATEEAQYKKGSIIVAAASPAQRVVRLKENGSLYYVKDNQYFSIYDERIVSVNYPNLSIEKVSASELSSLTAGLPVLLKDGTLFGIEGENNIYAVEHGKKRHIVSEDVFNGIGYDWNNIVWINTFAGMAHETGEPIYMKREVVIASDDSTISDTNTSSGISTENSTEAIQTSAGSVMWRTPEEETAYVGPEYTTDVNTYLVTDFDSGKILAGKNIDSMRPAASFTKIMTAYLLFKEGINLQASVTYDTTLHKSVYHRYNIGDGDKVLNKDLLSAMLVSSLNTPANMLVYSVEKNRSAFIERMNAEAKEIGLKKTVFMDVTGEKLETKTTAREYLGIFNKAVRNSDLRKYLGAKSYSYDKLDNPSGRRKNHFDSNSNELINMAGLDFNILASKTGYLDEAGSGIAMLVERPNDKKKFIVITMGNQDYNNRFIMPKEFTSWALNRF